MKQTIISRLALLRNGNFSIERRQIQKSGGHAGATGRSGQSEGRNQTYNLQKENIPMLNICNVVKCRQADE